jgi:hypothetical protein
MRTITPLLLATIMVSPAPGQEPQNPSCSDASFRQFDFWLGTWEVKDASGKIAGSNTVRAQHQGCAISEEWRSATGSAGSSINYYDPRTSRWKQIWISPGALLEMSGGLQGQEMILEGPLQDLMQSRTTLLRGVWTPLPDGRVRQHFTESKDGGKTWDEWFDGYYQRTRD